jgi:hypothetical protein
VRRTLLGSSAAALAVSAVAAFLGCGAQTQSSTTTVGLNAPSYLRSTTPNMVVEVAPVTGHDPDPTALALLLQRARERCDKPGGIQLVLDPDLAPASSATPSTTVWTLEGLVQFAAAHRQVPATADTTVLFVEYVDGKLGSPANILGVAFDADSIAVFRDQLVESFGGGAGAAEGRVLVHEMGHELGLVNEGTRMVAPHEDPEHPGHDSNPGCVMFWTLHGSFAGGIELPPDDYDAACKADLQAAGGR